MKARYLVVLGLLGGACYLVQRSPASSAEPSARPASSAEAVAAAPSQRRAAIPEHVRAAAVRPAPPLELVKIKDPVPPVYVDRPGREDAQAELVDEPDESEGAMQGRITDAATGEMLAGVTVTATSAEEAGDTIQAAITDENGDYRITSLAPGEYRIHFYYLQVTVERTVTITGAKTTPVYQKLGGPYARPIVAVEEPVIEEPVIEDPATDPHERGDYIKHIPVPGRTFESVLGAAAGSQGQEYGDAIGISFSCGTSLENTYVVDGIDTTGLTFD